MNRFRHGLVRLSFAAEGDVLAFARRRFGHLAFGIALTLAPICASAQTIGVAATIRNDVAQVKASQSAPIDEGENVVRNEVVRTGAASAAKLVFTDNTNLALGPTSTVTLDRFVFAGDTNYQKATVNLVRGAFRFSTGSSDKKAYEINTPVATIGVRGTELDISSQSGETLVRLNHGATIVCTRSHSQCLVLTNNGDTVIVTAGGVRRTSAGGGPGAFTFEAFCGTDGLCEITQFADARNGSNFAALCGR
jgi:hypothetical protein